MKKGIHDQITDEVIKRDKLFQDELVRRTKGTKPFRMEPVDNDMLLVLYQKLSDNPEQMEYAINKYGPEIINQRIMEFEQMKQRRQL